MARNLACILVLSITAAAHAAQGGAGEWSGVAFGQRTPPNVRAWFVLPTRLVTDDDRLPLAAATAKPPGGPHVPTTFPPLDCL